jgi:hypothetical protein
MKTESPNNSIDIRANFDIELTINETATKGRGSAYIPTSPHESPKIIGNRRGEYIILGELVKPENDY